MPRTQRSRNAVPASIHGPRIGFLLCVLALVLIGFVMVYSAGSISNINNGVDALKSLTDQVMYAVFGALVAFAIYRFVPVSIWRTKWLWVALALLVVVILLTALFGVANHGATRWLRLGPVTIQVSEFAKIVFALVSARIYTDFVSGEISGRRCFAGFFLLVLVPLAIIYKSQSDLGTTMICIVAILAVLWYGELPIGIFAIIVAVIVVFGLIAMFGTGYRANRWAFLNPWDDGQGGRDAGYNIIHSYYALAEGGLFGVGLGNGHEKYQYLFASDSDFVFAVIGEEFGMVGCLAVIALFLGVLYTGTLIARAARDDFSMMIAGGLTIALVFQAFLNIACAIGVFPTTGKPLPFISSGGSSILASLIMVGLILSVSRDAASSDEFDRRRSSLRVVRREEDGTGDSPRDAARSGARRSTRGRSYDGGRGQRAASNRTESRTAAGWPSSRRR